MLGNDSQVPLQSVSRLLACPFDLWRTPALRLPLRRAELRSQKRADSTRIRQGKSQHAFRGGFSLLFKVRLAALSVRRFSCNRRALAMFYIYAVRSSFAATIARLAIICRRRTVHAQSAI
jgi:hypothetical protein